MSVEAGFVGSSAKLETGKEWMSEARKELRLTSNGWMSEMIGESVEIRFINIVDITAASIYELMGSPTAAGNYIFENTATISADTQSGTALSTGTFPAGSTLKIINKGYIRGGGGNGGFGGGSVGGPGFAGGSGLSLNFAAIIDNTAGFIYGGGGGGGGAGSASVDGGSGGGGGAGSPVGIGGKGAGYYGVNGVDGTIESGGNGGPWKGLIVGYGGTIGNPGTQPAGQSGNGGGGGGAGAAGGLGGLSWNSTRQAGGAAGYSVQSNGHAVTWIGGNTAPRVYGPIV